METLKKAELEKGSPGVKTAVSDLSQKNRAMGECAGIQTRKVIVHGRKKSKAL